MDLNGQGEKVPLGQESSPQRLKPDLFRSFTYGLQLAAARQPVRFEDQSFSAAC
jgi:hypothetical protein